MTSLHYNDKIISNSRFTYEYIVLNEQIKNNIGLTIE